MKFKEAHKHNLTFITKDVQLCFLTDLLQKKGSRTRFVLPEILPGQLQDSDYGMLRPTLKQTWGGACTLGT